MYEKIPATIAIVDYHALTRKTLSCRLASLGYDVIMEAENVKEFIDQLKAHSAPNIVLLDAKMPVAGWLATAIHMKRIWPGIKILFFSMPKSEAYISRLMEIGVDGFISKKAPFEELNKALLNMKTSATLVDISLVDDSI
jgi:DNA-binding NarL/FixJ family response regulator